MADDIDPRHVEAVARALCIAQGLNPDGTYPLIDGPRWQSWIDDARAAISTYREALGADGLVIVPREPTREMWDARAKAWREGGQDAWRAMVAAAKEGTT